MGWSAVCKCVISWSDLLFMGIVAFDYCLNFLQSNICHKQHWNTLSDTAQHICAQGVVRAKQQMRFALMNTYGMEMDCV